MRLLFCTTDGSGAFNGINAWLLDFLPALVSAGHDPSVLIFAWSPAGQCPVYARLRERGVPARVIFPMRYTEAAVRLCLREALRLRPRIFVANHVLPGLLALPAIRAAGIHGVSVLHNDDDEYRAKATLPADATVAVSSRILGCVPPDGRLSRVIPCGVPASPRIAVPSIGPEAPFRLIYHGRIACVQKRIVETADALARVCRAHPRIHADIYGAGPDEDLLRARILHDDGDGRLRFLGARTSAELRTLLPGYHASVLLSDFEGLPVSVLESMVAGVVPICLRTESGLPELIHHEKNGFLLANRELDFDSAVARLLDSPEDWSRLSGAARDTVQERFSITACVRDWEILFDDILARKPDPAAAAPSLPPPIPALLNEDRRHPGAARALWRWLRFGPFVAPRPW